jgi:glycosyltransferase involved in cell wall biosynthesis
MKQQNKIIYINNGARAHKILPLLSDQDYSVVYSIKDIFILFQNRIQPSFVLVDSFGRQGLLALIASILLRSPFVVRLRGDFFEESKYRRRHLFCYFPRIRYILSIKFGWFMMWKAKGIIYNSEYLKKKISFAENKTLTTVVYNPFTPLKDTLEGPVIEIDPNGFILLSATNMNLESKIMYQLNRMLEIPASIWNDWNMYWYICGDGVFKNIAKSRVESAGLGKRIIFTGKIKNIDQYLQACHVCIHFSRMDAFPNITLEAMYYRKPVITNYDSCGTREQILHGKNGLILQDSDSVADAINIYRKNTELRKKHGDYGFNYLIEKFTISTQKEKIEKFFRKLDS